VRKLQPFYKFFIGIVLLSCSACSPLDKSAISDVLDARITAINNQDIEAYRQVITAEYLDQGRSRADVISQMQQLFERFESIQMQSYNRHIHISDSKHAECEQSYSLKVFADGEWRNLVQREQLKLLLIKQQWKINAGL